jgi:O-antigen/teichoic acid export membrane protein
MEQVSLVWVRLRALAASNYVLYLLPSIVQGGVTLLLLVPVTTYFLDPEDFGVFALVVAITIPVKAFAATGAQWMIGGNYFHVAEAERRTLLFNVLAVDLALRSLLILLIYLMGETILRSVVTEYQPVYLNYLHLALAATWAGSLWPTISFLFTVQGRPKHFALISLIQIAVNGVTTVICLAVLELGVESLFFALLVTNLISLIFEVTIIRHSVAFSLKLRWLREILRTGMHATPGGLAEMASNMADKIIIQRFAGIGALGLYSHSLQYLAIFKMLSSALNNTMAPRSLRIFSQGLHTTPLELALTTWYGMLALMGVGVALFADELITLLTHGKFTASASLVPIWYLLVFSTAHAIPYATFLTARKHIRTLNYTKLVPTLIGIGLMIAGAYYYGMAGVAWVILAISVAIQTARRWVAQRAGYRGIAERAFVEALVIYLAAWILDSLFHWSFWMETAVFVAAVPLLILRFKLVSGLASILSFEKSDTSH